MIYCVLCGSPAEHHHLKTRKAHPEYEHKDWNKIAVCRKHHRMFHDKGTKYMADTFEFVTDWLKHHKWYYDEVLMRYEHAKVLE
jgi:hypothetical protein